MHPILIDFGFFRLSTYGTFVALAYLAAILWLKSQIRWMPGMNEDKFWTMIYGLFFGAVAGGKLLYIALNFQLPLSADLHFIRDFRYGFVFYGGLLGALAMGLLIRRWIRVPYLAVADYFGAALPMGHWLGRLGCLGAGCCYGKPTAMPWGIYLGGKGSTTPRELWGVPLHPTQLYEAASSLLICAFLLFFALPRAKRKELVPGSVFAGYLILYAAARFTIEFYRGDDRGPSYASLYVSQWIAIACAIIGAGLIARNGLWARER